MSGVRAVDGTCPACGSMHSLILTGGVVTCAEAECPNPTAVAELLQDSEVEHIVLVSAGGWTIRHPLRERIGDELLRCDLGSWLHEHHTRRGGPPVKPGRYRVTPLAGWSDADWEELDA